MGSPARAPETIRENLKLGVGTGVDVAGSGTPGGGAVGCGSGVHVGTAVGACAVAAISTGGWLSSLQATSIDMATAAASSVGVNCRKELPYALAFVTLVVGGGDV